MLIHEVRLNNKTKQLQPMTELTGLIYCLSLSKESIRWYIQVIS